MMMAQMLTCSIILPLGDFSLLNELPGMYHAYQKIATTEDQGIFDFVGDYLLGGKSLLGHNKHDRPDKTNAIQFQHASAIVFIVHMHSLVYGQLPGFDTSAYNATHLPGKPTDYHSSLLRPPLA
jgi:hypothetical protein